MFIHLNNRCKKKTQELATTIDGLRGKLFVANNKIGDLEKTVETNIATISAHIEHEQKLRSQLEEQKAIVNYTLLEKEKLEADMLALKKKTGREIKDLCSQIKHLKKNNKNQENTNGRSSISTDGERIDSQIEGAE